VVWRRSKLGLRMNADEIVALDEFMASRRGDDRIESRAQRTPA
jgi:hypothetical protein